ncbi:hypothetical protein GCM10010472_14360 [Pseudonocardia halophobica]|uniref:Uncharacterized protein n=1 Tax=Pseudonocardia halophobica TaxID=29401 RepID=A0A9W6NXM1_9PSEU|nr:hypothetical protein GCM10017577_39950 [Pseudonocardia halophobica]
MRGDRTTERVPDDGRALDPVGVEHPERIGDVLLQVPRRGPRRPPVPTQVDAEPAQRRQRLCHRAEAQPVPGDAVQGEHRRAGGVAGEVDVEGGVGHAVIVPPHPDRIGRDPRLPPRAPQECCPRPDPARNCRWGVVESRT